MEEYTNEQQEETSSQVKRWFQDNLRIIVSVIIVAAIAGGIYSYSKRVESPIVVDESSQEQDQQAAAETEKTADNAAKEEKADAKKETVSQPSSKETETSFVETAGKGDGTTKLARRALENYLEKNPDSQLSKEHKIYIEDYLRKNVPQKHVGVGATVEFSKDLIQKAVDQSKKLNERQLKNLQKYSARVTTIS